MVSEGCEVIGLKTTAKVLTRYAKSEDSGKHHTNADGETFVFNKYTLPDGHVFTEDLQDTVVVGTDRLIFLALRDEDGRWFKWSRWSEAEMEIAAEDFKFGGIPTSDVLALISY